MPTYGDEKEVLWGEKNFSFFGREAKNKREAG
jgi:hypothetical protein